jgi:hypothetical protein
MKETTPAGNPDIVNISESRHCCFCGGLFSKRKQMWKYPDGNYTCIPCKARIDSEYFSKEYRHGRN